MRQKKMGIGGEHVCVYMSEKESRAKSKEREEEEVNARRTAM